MLATNTVCIESGGHRERAQARRDELVLDHLSLAEGIARAVARTLPRTFELEDLIGTAKLALIKAATRFRPAEHPGVPFGAYARHSIRGAVIDSATGKNWPVHISADDPDVHLRQASYTPCHDDAIDRGRRRRRAAEAIATLPRKQQRLLSLVYGRDEPSVAGAARAMGIQYPGAYWMHGQALTRIRRELDRAA